MKEVDVTIQWKHPRICERRQILNPLVKTGSSRMTLKIINSLNYMLMPEIQHSVTII